MGVCVFFCCKKWTFPQRRVHYFFGGDAYAPNAPLAYGPDFSPSDCCEAAGGLVFCCCFLFSYHIIDSCQTIYLNIYRTLRQIFRICRTVFVDDQSEISFSIPQGTLQWRPFSVGFIYAAEPWQYSVNGVSVR